MSTSTTLAELGLDEALLLLVGRLRGSSAANQKILVPRASTDARTGAILVASDIPSNIPFSFHGLSSREGSEKAIFEN